MTRVAVVDLGTNSTRLLVADVSGGRVKEVARRLTITRLGEQVDEGRRLLPAAVARVEACLDGYCREADALGAGRSLAFATSAVRDAVNGRDFLGAIERRFAIETRLLSGDEEALLTFRGVAAARLLDRPTFVLDLGGGSAELVVGAQDRVTFRASLELGCVRLTERYLRHDPPRPQETAGLRAHVRGLVEHMRPDVRPSYSIGVAGTMTTLATVDLGLADEDPALVDGHVLTRARIESEAGTFARATVAELAKRPGIHPGRAPVIAAGALALAEILTVFGLDSIEVSVSDILHGAALELATKP